MRINLPEANQNAKPEQVSQVIENAADSLHVLTENSTPHITVFEKRIGTRLVGGGAASAILTDALNSVVIIVAIVATAALLFLMPDIIATGKAIRLTPPSGA